MHDDDSAVGGLTRLIGIVGKLLFGKAHDRSYTANRQVFLYEQGLVMADDRAAADVLDLAR